MQNFFNWLRQFGPFGFMALFLLLLFGMLLIAALFARQRTKAMQELAEALGFEFLPLAGLEILKQLPRFQLLTAGRNQQVTNLLSGSTESTQVMIFDWRYMTGGGKHSASHLTTVVAIQSVDLDLAPFYCRPETVLDWLGLTFDGKDIDFEDRPVFSKKFHLHGSNETQVRQLFDVEVCEFFELHPEAYAEGRRDWLIYYQNDKGISPDKLQDHFKDAFALYVLLKGRYADAQSIDGTSTAAIPDQARDEMSPESEREF